MRCYLSFLWITVLFYPSINYGDSFTLYSRIDGFAYTEPVGFKSFTSDWSGRYYGGTHAQLNYLIEFGASYRDWGIGYVKQKYLFMRFTEDSANFYYLSENKKPLQTDQGYDIDIDADYLVAEGVRLFKDFRPHTTLLVTLGASLLEGQEMLKGSLKGKITALSDSDYDFENLNIDYFYTEDRLFDRQVDQRNGQGYALDLRIAWQLNDTFTSKLTVSNLLGKIEWKQSHHTAALVESDNKEYDENGYVDVSPTLSGQHSTKDFTQTLPRIVQLRLEQQLKPPVTGIVDIRHTTELTFSSIGLAYHFASQSSLEGLYTFNSNAFALGYYHRWGFLMLQADTLSLNKSRNLGIGLGINISI